MKGNEILDLRKETDEGEIELFSHLAVAIRGNFGLLRNRLLHGSAKGVLQSLYVQIELLLGSGSAEQVCSVLLRSAPTGSWEPEGCRTRP